MIDNCKFLLTPQEEDRILGGIKNKAVNLVFSYLRYIIHGTEPLNQCCESGPVLDRDSFGSLDPYPDPEGHDPKHRKKLINFILLSARCSLLRDEGFSCSLDVLYEGLEISKLKFLIKRHKKFFSCIFFFSFWS